MSVTSRIHQINLTFLVFVGTYVKIQYPINQEIKVHNTDTITVTMICGRDDVEDGCTASQAMDLGKNTLVCSTA